MPMRSLLLLNQNFKQKKSLRELALPVQRLRANKWKNQLEAEGV